MTEWELRWILLAIGIVILAVIYLVDKKRRSAAVSQELQREPPETDEPFEQGDPLMTGEPLNDALTTPELRAGDADDPIAEAAGAESDGHPHAPGKEERAEPEPQSAVRPPLMEIRSRAKPKPRTPQGPPSADAKLVVLHVVALASEAFSGESIRQAAAETQLEFDDRAILQRTVELGGREQTLFSVANMIKPGSFPRNMQDFHSPGVTLFMQLPGPVEGLRAFNTMLDCGQRLATLLGGELLDDTHSVLGRQTMDHLREEIQLFSLRNANAPKNQSSAHR